jgi:hypothetical protein
MVLTIHRVLFVGRERDVIDAINRAKGMYLTTGFHVGNPYAMNTKPYRYAGWVTVDL